MGDMSTQIPHPDDQNRATPIEKRSGQLNRQFAAQQAWREAHHRYLKASTRHDEATQRTPFLAKTIDPATL
jgi:hypothetical protein